MIDAARKYAERALMARFTNPQTAVRDPDKLRARIAAVRAGLADHVLEVQAALLAIEGCEPELVRLRARVAELEGARPAATGRIGPAEGQTRPVGAAPAVRRPASSRRDRRGWIPYVEDNAK